jgi:hypothetical protein
MIPYLVSVMAELIELMPVLIVLNLVATVSRAVMTLVGPVPVTKVFAY